MTRTWQLRLLVLHANLLLRVHMTVTGVDLILLRRILLTHGTGLFHLTLFKWASILPLITVMCPAPILNISQNIVHVYTIKVYHYVYISISWHSIIFNCNTFKEFGSTSGSGLLHLHLIFSEISFLITQ